MTLFELDAYFRSFLNFDAFSNDPSKNGIQVQNAKPSSKEIKKVCFSVDACLETIEKAVEAKADVLFVHHGLFWGYEQTLVSNHYQRIKKLIENDIALYACHIPLDANEDVGNNYGLARQLELIDICPFGLWKNMSIGIQGRTSSVVSIENIIEKLLPAGEKPLAVFDFGTKEIQSVAIVSGGAEDLMSEAIDKSIDLYITGELSHESYHTAKEAGMNVVAGGHYNTETKGVSLLAQKLLKDKKLETVFLDVPTGL